MDTDTAIAAVFAFASLLAWDGHRRTIASRKADDASVLLRKLDEKGAQLQDALKATARAEVSVLTQRVSDLEQHQTELRREMADLGMSRLSARRS